MKLCRWKLEKKFSKNQSECTHLPPSLHALNRSTHTYTHAHNTSVCICIYFISIIYVHLSLHLPPESFSLSDLPFWASPTHAYTKTNTIHKFSINCSRFRCLWLNQVWSRNLFKVLPFCCFTYGVYSDFLRMEMGFCLSLILW